MPRRRGIELIEGIVYLPGDLLLEIPSLENGANFRSNEFIKRSELHPRGRRAELLAGIVYLPMAAENPGHLVPQELAALVLGTYAASHEDTGTAQSMTVVLDDDNVVEPDAMLFRTGGLDQAKYFTGSPELVAEVANSSVSRDLHQKKEAYRRNGVREYIVWRVQDEAIDWFELRDGEYVRREPDASGMIESVQFTGLRLDVGAALALDRKNVLAALDSD